MIEGTLPFTNADRPGLAGFVDLETKKNDSKKANRNMKTITKTVLYLQMTALLLTAAFAGSAEVPLRGFFQGVDIADVQFPKLFVDGSGSGNATHLGRFTLAYELEVDLLTLPIESFGSSVFTAANGDSLFTDIIGLATPTENADVVSIVEVHTITGGTGRFAGATGSFIRKYSLHRVTLVSSGSFDGTIALNNAN